MSADNSDNAIRERSGWLIPLAVFVLTAGLSALMLLYYFAPTPTSLIEKHAAPTTRTDTVTFSIDNFDFKVPANYLIYASTRQGGAQSKVEMFTTFPDFKGYSDATAPDFSGNAADSPKIFLLLREEPLKISETERLQRIYMSYVADPAGKPGPFGLTQYTFRDDSGYHGEDLFVGSDNGKTVVFRCVRFSADVPSPSCLRDLRLGRDVALSYRFKRAHLGHWHQIVQGIDRLMETFIVKR